MKITNITYYDGAREKVCRLGLADLFLEVQQILLSTKVEIVEEREVNGSGTLREMIDAQFHAATDWIKTAAGGIDWVKKIRYNSTFIARIGVEIQVSARSDLIVRDIVHLRNRLQEGTVDVGVIVVPSDRLQRFCTDRTPSFRDAVRLIEVEFKEATTFPIIVMAVEHDGASAVRLIKKPTNRSKAVKQKPESHPSDAAGEKPI